VSGYLVDYAHKRWPDAKLGIVYEGTAWGQGAVPDIEAALKRAT